VNSLPLIEVTVQLPERGKRIRQAFEAGRLLGLAFLHMLVRLVHGRPLKLRWRRHRPEPGGENIVAAHGSAAARGAATIPYQR
jgi:hypothetical protein